MGDYELSVEQTESKISEIVIALSEKKAWDKHTVITLLNRMEKKGAVTFERNGRAKEYYPLISQKETVKQETEQFLSVFVRAVYD